MVYNKKCFFTGPQKSSIKSELMSNADDTVGFEQNCTNEDDGTSADQLLKNIALQTDDSSLSFESWKKGNIN